MEAGTPHFEIVIADQSSDGATREVMRNFPPDRIRYIKSARTGKGYGLNECLACTRGDIIAFTDDDCIPARGWVSDIGTFFRNNPGCDGVLGRALPYGKNRHRGLVCPSIAVSEKPQILHPDMISDYSLPGYGNNMSFRKSVFGTVGYFKSWLGGGAVGGIAEDSEFLYRALTMGIHIEFDPRIVVYHDRWLTYDQEQFISPKYTKGIVSSSTYYLLRKHPEMLKPIRYKIRVRILSKIRLLAGLIFSGNVARLYDRKKELIFILLELLAVLEGLLLGTFYSLYD